jgi:hypothetical protein
MSITSTRVYPLPSPQLVAVAEAILEHFDKPISTMKLQKLVYFAQGWSLGLTGKPLFDDESEAWASGPASPALYGLHRGEYSIGPGFFRKKMAEILAQPPVIPDDVLERAQVSYDAWYDAEPVPGEEDSLSHEYVRETVPDLLEALRASRAEVATLKALSGSPVDATE